MFCSAFTNSVDSAYLYAFIGFQPLDFCLTQAFGSVMLGWPFAAGGSTIDSLAPAEIMEQKQSVITGTLKDSSVVFYTDLYVKKKKNC